MICAYIIRVSGIVAVEPEPVKADHLLHNQSGSA
jgi:hypothetical protein